MPSPHPEPYEQKKFLVDVFAKLTETPLRPGEDAIRDYIWCESDGILYIRRAMPTDILTWYPVDVPPNDTLINFQVTVRCRQNVGDLRPTLTKKAHARFRRGSRAPMSDPIANLTWWYATSAKIGLDIEDAGVELESRLISKESQSRNYYGTRPAFHLLASNFYGVAKICDRSLFERALTFGVGDAKAFGLGFIFFWQRGQDNG